MRGAIARLGLPKPGSLSVILLLLASNAVLLFRLERRAAAASAAAIEIAPGFRAVRWSSDGPLGQLQKETLRPSKDGQRTLLYVMRPGCEWCERNHSQFVKLASGLADVNVVVFSLTTERLSEELATRPFTWPVLADLDHATLVAYRLGPTPTTLLISPKGQIVRRWYGAYNDTMETDIVESLRAPME